MANEIVVLKLQVGTDGKIEGIEKIESTAKKAGEKSGEKFSDGFSSSIKGVGGAVLKVGALITGALGAISFTKSIKSAMDAEDSLNRFATSLQITNRYTKEAVKDFQEFASVLQSQTKFGDDAILSTAGLIQQLANLDQTGLKNATRATLDLASAMRIDLETAGALVGKAINGNVGAIGRYVGQVKQGATETETLSNVLTAIEKKFGGSAQAQIKTFSGALTQTNEIFGDLLEEIGFVITKNPLVVEAIKLIGKSFSNAIIEVQKFRKSFDMMNDLVIPLSKTSEQIITFVVAPMELSVNAVTFLINKIKEWGYAFQKLFSDIQGMVATIFEKLDLASPWTRELKAFNEASTKAFNEAFANTQKSFQSIFDFPLSAGLVQENAKITEQIKAMNDSLNQNSQNVKNNLNNSLVEQAETTKSLFEQVKGFLGSFNAKFTDSATSVAETSKQLTQVFKASLVNGISGGIQNIVNSLANGENAFKNLGKFFLQTIGDMAIQMGQVSIGIGLSIKALQGLEGAQAVAAGVGLVALGAIIKSFAGGGGSTSSAGATGAGNYANQAGPVTPTQLSEPEDIEQRNVGPRVQLVVQGDILDSDQTANRILDLLNKNFSDSGGSFNGASFA